MNKKNIAKTNRGIKSIYDLITEITRPAVNMHVQNYSKKIIAGITSIFL